MLENYGKHRIPFISVSVIIEVVHGIFINDLTPRLSNHKRHLNIGIPSLTKFEFSRFQFLRPMGLEPPKEKLISAKEMLLSRS